VAGQCENQKLVRRRRRTRIVFSGVRITSHHVRDTQQPSRKQREMELTASLRETKGGKWLNVSKFGEGKKRRSAVDEWGSHMEPTKNSGTSSSRGGLKVFTVRKLKHAQQLVVLWHQKRKEVGVHCLTKSRGRVYRPQRRKV